MTPIKDGLWYGGEIWSATLLDEEFIEGVETISVIDKKAKIRLLKMTKSFYRRFIN